MVMCLLPLILTKINRWFSVTMGTGIVSILLHNLPYNAVWLYWLSVVVFALNVLLFATFTCISIVRYVTYPEIWTAMVRHGTQSLFLGTFPMGFATIVNMVVFVCVPALVLGRSLWLGRCGASMQSYPLLYASTYLL